MLGHHGQVQRSDAALATGGDGNATEHLHKLVLAGRGERRAIFRIVECITCQSATSACSVLESHRVSAGKFSAAARAIPAPMPSPSEMASSTRRDARSRSAGRSRKRRPHAP
jgi:hypothetical protein